MKTPLQKAFKDYYNNQYWIPQAIALVIFTALMFNINEFESTFDILLILAPVLGAFFVPFIYLFIWASQYKKGTRK
jgi:hypothetical protein